MNRLFRIMLLVKIAMLMVVAPAASKVRPLEIDSIYAIMEEMRVMMENGSSEDEILELREGKTQRGELYFLIAQCRDAISTMKDFQHCDAIDYKLNKASCYLTEQVLNYFDRDGLTDGLYINTADNVVMPMKYEVAKAYGKILDFSKEDSLYMRIPADVKRDFGENSEEFVALTSKCAKSLCRRPKNYRYAKNLLLEAVDAAHQSSEVSDYTACDFFTNLARICRLAGKHNESLMYAQEALSRVGSDRKSIFDISSILSELYWLEGNHEKGWEYFCSACENADDLSDYMMAAINFADILRRTGYYDEAEGILLKIEPYLESDDLTEPDLFRFYEAMGMLYTFSDPEKSAASFAKAEEYVNAINTSQLLRFIINSQVIPNEDNSFKVISALDRAELIFNMMIGDDPAMVMEILTLKGKYLADIHDYKEARKYLEAAYLYRYTDYVPEDPQHLLLLRQLIRIDEIEGEYERCEAYFNELLAGARVHGVDSGIYADARLDLLHYYLRRGNVECAAEQIQYCRRYQPSTFDFRSCEYQLSMLEGNFDTAEKQLESMRKEFPERKEDIDLMYHQFYHNRKSPEIAKGAKNVYAHYRNQFLRNLLFMSNSERRNMDSELRCRRNEIITAIQFAPEVTELAFDYSLFSKGLLFHTQNELNRMLTLSDSARIEIAQIHGLKSDLTRAINTGDTLSVRSIRSCIDARERYLTDDFLDFEAFTSRFEKYSRQSLKSVLPEKCGMIEFVEYDDNSAVCLGAFVEGGERNPLRFVALGKCENLDIEQMYIQIWSKLLPYLTDCESVYFSTDGMLNTLPIEFAEDSSGRPVCESYDLHRVFHLCDVRPACGLGERVELIGVADHNSPPGEAARFEESYRGNWSDLTGVETELYRISDILEGRIDYKRVFNDDATESYLKKLSGEPVTTLHISTHGFYRGENDLLKAYSETSEFDHYMAQRMLMCGRSSVSGLVMRGGNQSWKSQTIGEEEDNLLTSEEVETLTFPSLNLTVLSACETGLGELSSDGVWGLQRAFRIAGSSALICSLRQLSDNGAADFMAEFYRQATGGLSIHEAFYSARNELLNQDPAKKMVWSSFILIE